MTSQTHSMDKDMIPRALVRAVAALMLTVLVLVTLARLTDRALIATPPDDPVVAERQIRLSGDTSGSAQVYTSDGALIADLAPEDGGFISGVWRAIQRERIKARIAPDGPVIVRQDTGGRVSIHDPSTGWSADLMGFGQDNARAFARLLAQ